MWLQAEQKILEVTSATFASSGSDAGYLGFKVAKLGELTLGIRKELDNLQPWKDKVEDCEVSPCPTSRCAFIEPASPLVIHPWTTRDVRVVDVCSPAFCEVYTPHS